jgi:NADH-quinone oxidoreductase subunit J
VTFFFLIFAVVSVAAALLVITQRSPLYAALFLALTLCAQAGLFTLLGAFFVGVIQVLIYAGAILILFLFVIMSLNPEETTVIPRRVDLRVASGFIGGLLVLLLLYALSRSRPASAPMSTGAAEGAGHVELLGEELFSTYLVPFEIGTVLLLVSILGAVVLAARHRRRT